MRPGFRVLAVFFVGFFVLPVLAQAYTADALNLFQAGKQYQAAKQLKAAVMAYRGALKADPTLTMAYKALGTVYYQAGDRKGALFFYDRYLTTNPDDTATKNFADSIRASLGQAAPAQDEAVAPTAPKKKKRH